MEKENAIPEKYLVLHNMKQRINKRIDRIVKFSLVYGALMFLFGTLVAYLILK